MQKLELPNNQKIIQEIVCKYNNEIVLAGSCADHYNLNRSYSLVKDIDFITTNTNIFKHSNNKLIKVSTSRFGELYKYITVWEKSYLLELFIVSSISSKDLAYNNKLNIFMISIYHRKNIIDKILNNNLNKIKKDKFIQLKLDYNNLIS